MANDNKQSNITKRELSPRHLCAWNHLYRLRSAFAGYSQIATSTGSHKISARIHIPEDRIIRPPLSDWISQLQSQLANLSQDSDLAVVINQASFIVALMGDIESAYRICNKAIDYYYARYKMHHNGDVLCQAIQPWINMARLHRICKNFEQSNQMFHFLSGCRPPSNRTEKIIKLALELAKQLNNIHSKVAENCFNLEPIVNAIENEDFQRLNEFLQNFRSRDFVRNPTLREAEIISQYYNETSTHYQISVFSAFNLCRIQDLDAFSLRLAEYFHHIDDARSCEIITRHLYHYCQDLLTQAETSEYAHLILCILQSTQAFGCQDQAYELSINLLDRYLTLNDEPGLIAILQIICNLPQSEKSPQYKKMLRKRLLSTDYMYLKKNKAISSDIKTQIEKLVADLFNV